MLYQTEGSDRYAILNELSMAVRYVGDPVCRRAAESLMEKLSSLTEERCMEIVKDNQKNFRLPQEGRNIGELITGARQKSGAEKLKGHDIMVLERFDPEVRHMVIFDVLSVDSPVGDKGDRMQIFLMAEGYRKFQASKERGEIKIRHHSASGLSNRASTCMRTGLTPYGEERRKAAASNFTKSMVLFF